MPSGSHNRKGVKTGYKGLSDRQRLFCAEYLVDFNGANAIRRAGYKSKNPKHVAYGFLKNPLIQELIQAGAVQRTARVEVTAERVIAEFAKIGFFDPRKLFDTNGSPIPITELDDDTAAVIAGMDIFEEFEGRGEERRKTGTVRKWKLADKVAALTQLGRYFSLFEDKVKVVGAMSDDDLLRIAKNVAERTGGAKSD